MDSLLLEDQEQVAVYDNEEEREKLYNTVLQNICSTLDSISKLEHDTKKATTCLQVELESKQAKENELKEKFQKFQNDIIAKARLSTRNDILNSTIIAEFGKDEKLKRQTINEMRLSLIKTKLQVQKLGKKLKSKEQSEDKEGVYEEVSVESQSLNAKLAHKEKEINKLKEMMEQSEIAIANVKAEIRTIGSEIKDKEDYIQSVEEDISVCGKKLSKLIAQHKAMEKTFKIQTAAASNKIVQENYISSIQVVNKLTSTLEGLKMQHQELSCSCNNDNHVS